MGYCTSAHCGEPGEGHRARCRVLLYPPMSAHMKAEIVSIGTEILLGEIHDTNSQFIASQLPGLGIDLHYVTQTGDNQGRLHEVLSRAWERSDLTLCTGGLGPTQDDVTRESVAAVVGEEPYVDQETLDNLRKYFAARGIRMPEGNNKQAWLLPSARSIRNPHGTAPGWWVEREGRVIVCMPGPPTEMTRMWHNEVVPELERRPTGSIIVSRTLKTIGIGEGTVDEMVGDLLSSSNPSIGTYARADGVHLRLTAKAPTAEQANALIGPLEERVRAILGHAIWGADEQTLPQAIGDVLIERGLTLASMESCTGGLLANTLTDIPGSSEYFVGALVSYATEMKIKWGVSATTIEEYGVISDETAREMARCARENTGADIGLGVTCVAGPAEQDGKPPGTVHIALDSAALGCRDMKYNFVQGREAVKRRAVTSALLLLRRAIYEES
ncbi:MAG: competence/damage-inducible protein A [Dehalococcoidia bacterium]|nr:competence/damage-inducible protein A [Dehalococcoidia bacterium]